LVHHYGWNHSEKQYGADDFEIPTRMRELWEKKEYGNYATNGD
jgi:hypothetical protein